MGFCQQIYLLLGWIPEDGTQLHVIALLSKFGLAVRGHLVDEQNPGGCQLALQQGGETAALCRCIARSDRLSFFDLLFEMCGIASSWR